MRSPSGVARAGEIEYHDELVFSVLVDEEEIVKKIVKNIMENTYKISVPIVADINIGADLYYMRLSK